MNLSVRIAAAATLAGSFAVAHAANITGAGATFPYPLYAKWAEAYKVKTGNAMNYQSIGSGGGIKQIKSRTVDFGASDKPLKPEELQEAGLTQFPTVVGGVVPVVNIPGIQPGQLKLTGPLLADIYMGKITKWNDPAIRQINPGVNLPATGIYPVRRSDGSGTTFVFTNYLSKISPTWAKDVGADAAVNWPGKTVGGKGNEGVANYVTKLKGSIGYVEYAYAKQNKIPHAALKNEAGVFVQPDEATFKAAAANAKWSIKNDFYEILTNQPGKDSWPITSATFILMPKKPDNTAQALEALKFFNWAYTDGGKMALDLDYIPLPDNVQQMIRDSWKQNILDANGKSVWK